MGRTLLVIGLGLAAIGLLLMLGERLPIRLGRLPGDFVWRGRSSVVYLPLGTSLLLSVVASLVLWLFSRR